MTSAIAAATADSETLGFDSSLIGNSLLSSDVINPGDILSITVWETVDSSLLASVGQKFTAVDQIQVDETGRIYVPHVGRVSVSGRTPEQVRIDVTEKLSNQTPDPQVEVRRIAGNGTTVSILGDVGSPGVYPIETSTRSLSSMIARAGGVSIVPEVAQIRVERGGRAQRIWLQDLYDRPELDIALRPGDRILIEQDRRSFTALGATEGQARISFNKRDMSAIEALAASGGLDGNSADPTGIFVFRTEDSATANRVLARSDLVGPQRVAYVMDLTAADGMFAAQEFVIRNEDTVYITEAPFSSWGRVAALTATVVSLAGSVAAIAN
ncbi:polysaccharide biosynthesis/export family protein [Amaricoccus tamworthensis]|uniref:polysaccharide biosynthesis/export family protein n=1 Tax=Amaricoccus tamworthensis TaxID=57002 RepID=UPI003C797E75